MHLVIVLAAVASPCPHGPLDDRQQPGDVAEAMLIDGMTSVDKHRKPGLHRARPPSLRHSVGVSIVGARIPQKRKGADASQSRTVKTTVSLDVGTLAKLAALAALRGSSQTALAAAFIKEGLRGVVAFEKGESSGPVEKSDRRAVAGEISGEDREDAA
jgi:hypothetical protein